MEKSELPKPKRNLCQPNRNWLTTNARSLRHENVVRVYGVFNSIADEQNAVVIMEYVGKRTLLSLIKEHPEAVTEQFQGKCFREGESNNRLVVSANNLCQYQRESCDYFFQNAAV